MINSAKEKKQHRQEHPGCKDADIKKAAVIHVRSSIFSSYTDASCLEAALCMMMATVTLVIAHRSFKAGSVVHHFSMFGSLSKLDTAMILCDVG